MKYLSINKLKNQSFTPVQALNEVINIQYDNIKSSKKDVDLLLIDIEKIREGMTIKNEELKRKLEDSKPEKCMQDFKKFDSQFQNKKISEITSIKHILDKHSSLEKLKNTTRIIYILKEIDNGNRDILKKLLSAEDEWSFLCCFLQKVLMLNSDPELHQFIKSSQLKTEETIVQNFESSFKKDQKITMKKCYDAMKSVDKQDIIIKSFMYLLPFFNENDSKYEEPTEVELESDIELDYFVKYVDNIEDLINDKFNDYIPVFADYEKVLEKISKKLYESVIFDRLEQALNTKNAVIYLLNLKTCYIRVQKLSESIKNTSSEIATDEFVGEVFMPYIQTAIDKEKAAFEVFFDLIARKKESGTKFLLHGQLLLHTDSDPKTILTKLVKLYSETLLRGKLFKYSADDLYEYNSFVLNKLNELINIICGNFTESDRLKLIKQLYEVYLIVKKVFLGEDQLEKFKDAIEDRIDIIFNNRIEESEAKSKHIIKKLTINSFGDENTPNMLKLCENIRRDMKLCNLFIKGTNKDIFMTRLLEYIHSKIYGQYLSFTYDANQSKTFANDMHRINNLVKEINIANVFGIYERLIDISDIVSCKKDDVIVCVNILQYKIPIDDVKMILKCRLDYNDVKKYLKQ